MSGASSSRSATQCTCSNLAIKRVPANGCCEDCSGSLFQDDPPFLIRSQRMSPSFRSKLVISGMKMKVTKTPRAPAAADRMNFIRSSTCMPAALFKLPLAISREGT